MNEIARGGKINLGRKTSPGLINYQLKHQKMEKSVNARTLGGQRKCYELKGKILGVVCCFAGL